MRGIGGRVAAAVTAVAGLSLTVAGALAPVSSPGAAEPRGAAEAPAAAEAPGGSASGSLDRDGGKAHEDPAELAMAQQAFGSRHFGGLGLATPQALSRAIERGVTQAAAVPRSRAFGRRWTLRGPRDYFANDPSRSGDLVNLGFQNLSGRVTTIATTPARPGLLWIGAADGGVWKSTNAGRTWHAMFDRQGTLAVGGMAIDPTDPDRVYVGTGEANTNADAFYGNGMYVTDDGGRHWRHVHLPGVLTVFHVEAAPPSRGFPTGRVFAATNHGLWLSTDRGRHYRNVALPTNAAHDGVYHGTPFGNFVTDVRVRPHHSNEVVAVVGWRKGSAKEPNGRPDSVGNGFYESTRSGSRGSFHYVSQDAVTGMGSPGAQANPLTDEAIGRTSLAYSADGKYLWAVVQDAGNFRGETFEGLPMPASNTVLNGVYMSPTGEPDSWVVKGNSQTFSAAPGSGLLVEQALLYAPGVQSWYDQWIAVDPRDDSRVLVGLEEVYEAVDNATGQQGVAQWRTVSRYWNGCAALSNVDCSSVPGPVYAGKATHPDQHAVAFVPSQNGQTLLYTGSDGGVFSQVSHPTDLGYVGYDNAHWRWLNLGLATTQPYYAVEGSDGTVYAGLQDNGEVKIQPGSTRGDEVYGGDGFDTAVAPGNSDVVYEEYAYGDISVSTDGGHTWTDIAPGDASSTQSQFAAPFAMDPKNADHLVAVGRFVDETTDGPRTGQPCYGDSDIVAVCTGAWTSTYDLGKSVVNGRPGVSGGGVNNIATAVSVDGAAMYVPFCGLCDPISQGSGNFSYFHNGIATNIKAGCTAKIGSSDCWHKAAAHGLPNRYIQGVAIDPRHHRTVYVALSGYLRRWWPNHPGTGAVYVSHDAGEHFTNVSGNLPAVPANAIVLRNGSVFVGTDQGVYTARQGSRHWTRVGSGLPNASVLDLRLNPDGTQLVAALHGRGVWTYAFGAKAGPAYRAHPAAGGSPVVPAGSGPSVRLPAVDARLLVSGLVLLVVAAALALGGRRRPVVRPAA